MMAAGDMDPRFRDMPNSTRVVLVLMAAKALDYQGKTIGAGHYFGGWHLLANALGHPTARNNTAGHKAVQRALRDLQARGIVKHLGPTEEGRPTARHVYYIDV